MAKPLYGLLALLAGCGAGADAPDAAPPDALDCSLEVVLPRWQSFTPAVDCGYVPFLGDRDHPDYYAARDCVLTAVANQQSFIVYWESDGHLGAETVHGFTGTFDGVEPTLLRFEHNPSPDGEPSEEYTDVYRCSAVIAEDIGCPLFHWTLCLECSDSMVLEECCEDIPTFDDGTATCIHN